MRYVDLNRLRLPDDWLAKAAIATSAVDGGADPDTYSSIWRDLKDAMFALSNGKCWYCETPIDRSDNAVDHFRPKKRVYDAAQPHSGYRWLAFEKSNFRYACTFCNSRRVDIENETSGGKADRFPLLDESKRVYTTGTIVGEEPELLDPCVIEDCEMLGCQQENGKPCSTKTDFISKRRVKSSIEIYHLDRDATCIQRHSIAVRLISDIITAKKLFEISQKDASKKIDFIEAAKNIERAINRHAPYSGEMRFLFRGQRAEKHEWMQQLLEA